MRCKLRWPPGVKRQPHAEERPDATVGGRSHDGRSADDAAQRMLKLDRACQQQNDRLRILNRDATLNISDPARYSTLRKLCDDFDKQRQRDQNQKGGRKGGKGTRKGPQEKGKGTRKGFTKGWSSGSVEGWDNP